MKRREFIAAFGGVVAWPVVARAQQPERMRRIGVLQPGSESDPESQNCRAAFVGGLQKFGWTEGTNVSIHYRWVGDDADRIRLYATELTGMRPDVIWASGSTQGLDQLEDELRVVLFDFLRHAAHQNNTRAGYGPALSRTI